MLKYERLSEKVYGLLAGYGYEVKLFNEQGDTQVDPIESTRFYVTEPTMMIHVDVPSKEVTLSISSEDSYKDTKKLQDRLKAICNEFLMNYTIRNYAKSNVARKDAMDAKVKKYKELNDVPEAVTESAMYGKKKVSFQDFGNYRVKAVHESEVIPDVRGARSRKIKRLYVESLDKSFTFQMPTGNLHCARALASHLNRGGDINDQVSNYINESASKVKKIREFASVCKSISSGDTSKLIEMMRDASDRMRNDMKCLCSNKKHGLIAEKIKLINSLNESNEQNNDIIEALNVISDSGIFGDIPDIMKSSIMEQNSVYSLITYDLSANSNLQENIHSLNSLMFSSDKSMFSFIVNEAMNSVIYPESRAHLSEICRKMDSSEMLSEFEVASLKTLYSHF